MAIGTIGFLAKPSDADCDHCSPLVCNISCDDGTLEACFAGKCMRITVTGFSNSLDLNCGRLNGTFTGPVHTHATPGSWNVPECSVLFDDDTRAWGVIRFPGDHCWPMSNPCESVKEIVVDAGLFYNITRANHAITGDEAVQNAINTLCAGGAVVVPFNYYINVADECNYSGNATIQLVDGSECGNSISTSYNCDAGTCVKVYDLSGTYLSLDQCIDSDCAKPPVSYACVPFGTCKDPQDGSGPYTSLEDCVDAGCAPPTCDSLDGCTFPTIAFAISGLLDCGPTGGDTYTLARLNGSYFLDYDSVSAGVYFFKRTLNPTPDNYASYDAAIQLYKTSVIGDTTIEYYVYAVEAHVTCADGETSIIEWQWKLKDFASTSGGPWSLVGAGTVSYTSPTGTLVGQAVGCTFGHMLSRFAYTDCNSVSQTMRVSGG